MFSLSGNYSTFLFLFLSGIFVPLYAQSGAWEVLCDTVSSQYGYSYKDVYPDGDILSIESRGAGNQFKCTRTRADMKIQRWSYEYAFDSLLVSNASSMFRVTQLSVIQFYIDSKDRIWIQVILDHSAISNHVYVLCIGKAGDLISSCRLDIEGIKWDFHERITFQETIDGVFFFDASGGRRSAEDSILLARFTIQASNGLQIDSPVNIKNEDYRNAYMQVKPRNSNLLLYDFGWASTFHFAIIDQSQNKMNAWKFSSPKTGFLYTAEWWSDSTLLMVFSDSQLSPITNDLDVIVCMTDLNGKVMWSKKIKNVAILKWGEYAHEHRLKDTLSQSICIPVSSKEQPLSGFVKLNARNGAVLDQFFWQHPDYAHPLSLVQKLGNQFHIQLVDGSIRNKSQVPSIYLINAEEDINSCFRVEHCHIADVPASVVLETVDIPMEVLHDSFIHRPGHDLFYRIKASVMSSSPHCELIQPLKDICWETDQALYCAYDTLGIILSNMGHTTNTEWSLNGSTINPVSTVRDTFFLAGPYDPEDEIQLTVRRLGCTWEHRIEIPISNKPHFHYPADTSFCAGNDLTLILPEIPDYNSYWSDGTNTLITNIGGQYQYILEDEILGCKFSGSIDVREDKISENLVGELQEFCEAETDKQLEVHLNATIDNAYWLEFPEISVDQAVIAEAGVYNLVVRSGTCLDTIQTEAIFSKCSICPFYIPSAFSPNSDGINDEWHVIYTCPDPISRFQMNVYDRWGNSVFAAADLKIGWDGTDRQMNAAEGIYIYSIEMEVIVNGKELTSHKTGTVTLIR